MCPQCGRRSAGDLCSTCRNDYTECALGPGRWVGGLVKRFIPDPTPIGRPRLPEVFEWDESKLLEAHRLFAAGNRDERTREGERVYHRERKRDQRARQARSAA